MFGFLYLYFLPTAKSATTSSNCFVTEVGKPKNTTLPAGCNSRIIPAPNIGPCKQVKADKTYGIPGKYCELPHTEFINNRLASYTDSSLGKLYEIKMQSNKWQYWASEDIINVLYTVARRWKELHKDGYLIIMDITSDYHLSHFWGVTVDLVATTNGRDCVADFTPYKGGRCDFGKYNAEATVELGKLFIDTGYMHTILHNGNTKQVTIIDEDNGKIKRTTVNRAIFDYAKNKYPTRFNAPYTSSSIGVIWVSGHEDHFHLYIDRDQNNYENNYKRPSDFWYIFDKSKLQDCRLVGNIGCKK